MKKNILLFLLLIPIIGFPQENNNISFETKLHNLPKESLKNYRILYDKFEHTTNIFSKSSDGANIKINIKIKGNECFLRLYSFYSSDSWLFVDTIYFLINNETYKIGNIDSSTREVGTGLGIVERNYINIDEDLLNVIKKIFDSPSQIDIRFSGKERYQDFKLSKKNIAAMKETLDLYNLLLQ